MLTDAEFETTLLGTQRVISKLGGSQRRVVGRQYRAYTLRRVPSKIVHLRVFSRECRLVLRPGESLRHDPDSRRHCGQVYPRTHSVSGWKMSSIAHSKKSASANANSKLGSYRPRSIALMVCRLTSTASASSACVTSAFARHTLRSLSTIFTLTVDYTSRRVRSERRPSPKSGERALPWPLSGYYPPRSR